MKRIPSHTLNFIDSWLTLCTKWEDVPGLSVSIAKDNIVIFDKVYGSANLESKELLTTTHGLRIASQSKVFTSVALFQLQERGRLRIDDLVVDYIPWLKQHTDTRWENVTLRQLMSHGAGVIRDGGGDDFWALRAEFPGQEGLKDLVLKSDLVLEPNTAMKYSNIGYSLLGLVVSKASSIPFGEYVTTNIIGVLELTNTQPEYISNSHMATGYSRPNLKRKRFPFPQLSTHALAPATGFCSTTADLAVFYSALIIGSGKILSDVSKREMQKLQWKVDNSHGAEYALGLELTRRDDGTVLFGHSGGFPGFLSRTYCDQKNGLVVSVVVTSHFVPISSIASSILDILYQFGDTEPKKDLLKFEQRFTTLGSSVEVVATANGLQKVFPHGWWVLDTVERLEVIDDRTLRVSEASGFSDMGELIVYTFDDDGKVLCAKESEQLLVPSVDDELIPWW